MSVKHKRVIGTTEDAIQAAETELKFQLPLSFREWLLDNNGLGLDDVWIFPVYDERDPRRTWDSIVRQYDNGQWPGEQFEDDGISFGYLLPFASFGTGDYYCFDYNKKPVDGESPVVLWSHEPGETEERGRTFTEFRERLAEGEFEDD